MQVVLLSGYHPFKMLTPIKKNSLLFMLFGIIQLCGAQSVYHIHYNQFINNEKVPTYGLFFQNEDGSGFLRTRYKDPASQEDMLLESMLTEEYITDPAGNADTGRMYVNSISPELILGNAKAVRNTPVFLFTLNRNSGEMEMDSIVTINAAGQKTTDKQAELNAAYVSADKLTRELFSNYFQEGDDFFENYFKPNTKDISPAEKNTVMHLLIVADTLQKDIGRSCAMDLQRTKEAFAYIAAYIGCKMNIRIVTGKDYNKRNVVSELKLLNPGPNDIVIFYYTGHGYRKPEDKRRYPYLDLRSKPSDDYLKETLNMEDIYNQVKQKGARTNLVLSDCCNSYVEATNAVGTKPFKKKGIAPELNSANIRSLFLNKISLLATAADSTQKASSNNTFGGFFSYFLKTSIESNCSKARYIPDAASRQSNAIPTWYNVLNETQKLTIQKAQHTYCDKPYIPQNICNQSPCFRVER